MSDVLTVRFEAAVDYATKAHEGQVRKGTEIPYVTHPIAVAGLVWEHGGDEDQAIAALLHDVLEDCGEKHAPEIEARFGARVRAIVEGLTDGVAGADGRKPPWRERKEAYLRHLAGATEDVLLVSLCDKLHNARAIASDLAEVGPGVFERFTAGRDGTVWYYASLAEVFAGRMGDHPAAVALQQAVAEVAADAEGA